jgi:diguanylate cyclase (GGDEF)-like protein
MYIPHRRYNEEAQNISEFEAFDSSDCHELLDAVIARGENAIVVIESRTGDLRDYSFVYKNKGFATLTGPTFPGGYMVRATVLSELFGDPASLSRIYASLDTEGRASLEHLTRALDGALRLLNVEITPLSLNKSGAPRWLVVLKNNTDTYNNGAKIHEMLAGARCMMWHALVEAVDGELLWTMRVLNEESAQRWMPIEMPEGASYAGYWPSAWLPGESTRMHKVSETAIWSGESSYQQEFRCRRADGEIRWISEDVRIDSRGPGRWRLVAVCTDITKQKAIEAEREQMLKEAIERADHDPLTGLSNHRAFHKIMSDESASAARTGSSFGLALMDIDNFKFFNDAYGHPVGDSVLCQVANVLRACCKTFDVLARFGGDEFAILMPDTSAMEAYKRADELIRCLDGIGYTPPGHNVAIPLTISVGVAVYPDDGACKQEIVNVADDRLIRAKTGEGDSEIFTEELKNRLADGFSHFTMLNALVSAVDNKDRYTRRHSVDVVSYTLEIARELDMAETDMFYIQIAALLHDVGKIGVPDAVLRKPGSLTDSEYDAIKQHPIMGAIMVGATPGFEPALDAVRHHHERWDGLGYPSGLSGGNIPLSARVMAVADAYSAMTTDRPYRKGMIPDIALSILEKGAGTQWDPDCVKAFLRARRAASSLES